MGATGSGTGGTSTGTGGSASGSGGIVTSTQNTVGSPIDSYDPILSATLSGDRATTPLEIAPADSAFYYGPIKAIRQNTNQYNFSYTQGWSTGTLATVSYNNDRLSNNILEYCAGFELLQSGAGWIVEGAGAATSVAGMGNRQQPAGDSDCGK